MTGLLIFGLTIALLVLALEPAQRRFRSMKTRLGEDTSRDRDRQRVLNELLTRNPHSAV